jgi:hypothetical protein
MVTYDTKQFGIQSAAAQLLVAEAAGGTLKFPVKLCHPNVGPAFAVCRRSWHMLHHRGTLRGMHESAQSTQEALFATLKNHP